MINKLFALLFFLLCIISSNAQSPQILYGNLIGTGFVGYDNDTPIFYKTADEYGLYQPVRFGTDSLSIKRVRESKLPVWNNEIRLLWVNNDMEIYTKRQPTSNDSNRDFIIVSNDGIDTVYIELNAYYQHNYEPFALTNDRKTLFAVQPGAYQDDLLGWYYDNIIKIDLTKKPLAAEKLSITGTELQLVNNFLFYKGGKDKLQNAILRVEVGNWEKIDTLTMHSYFWFVFDDTLFTEIGGYTNKDAWFGGNRYIAYSITERASAIVSKEPPSASDRHPILFEGEFYNISRGGLYKINIPKVTEFPYRQTLPR